ncbi:MAG: hypothetical protein AAB665_02885 [Patescibacteria group bacterium]
MAIPPKTEDEKPLVLTAELTPRTMLCLLENGFVPKRHEVFIDALFRDWDKVTHGEKIRFRNYIREHGMLAEKKRMKLLARSL